MYTQGKGCSLSCIRLALETKQSTQGSEPCIINEWLTSITYNRFRRTVGTLCPAIDLKICKDPWILINSGKLMIHYIGTVTKFYSANEEDEIT